MNVEHFYIVRSAQHDKRKLSENIRYNIALNDFRHTVTISLSLNEK